MLIMTIHSKCHILMNGKIFKTFGISEITKTNLVFSNRILKQLMEKF
jgi:hypothetical protein